jgi:hypothetical protein
LAFFSSFDEADLKKLSGLAGKTSRRNDFSPFIRLLGAYLSRGLNHNEDRLTEWPIFLVNRDESLF